ncbi:MAG: hypothetical protein ACE5J7_00185 [Candidatus Aenigmatarchaeota archaeon]
MKVTKESIWLVVTVIIVVVIFLVLIFVLSGSTPGDIFNAIQNVFTVVALFMIAQLQAILR